MTKAGLGLLACLFSLPALGCLPTELPASDPSSGAVRCLDKARPGVVTLLNETECAPCQNVLSILLELKKGMGNVVSFQVVWLDKDVSLCTRSALRFSALGENFCAKRSDAQSRWQVGETPTAFWSEGLNNRRVVGFERSEIWRNRLTKIKNGPRP
jgi:hypothetical protein